MVILAHGIEHIPNLAAHARGITCGRNGSAAIVKEHEVCWHPRMAKEALHERVEVASIAKVSEAYVLERRIAALIVIIRQADITGLSIR